MQYIYNMTVADDITDDISLEKHWIITNWNYAVNILTHEVTSNQMKEQPLSVYVIGCATFAGARCGRTLLYTWNGCIETFVLANISIHWFWNIRTTEDDREVILLVSIDKGFSFEVYFLSLPLEALLSVCSTYRFMFRLDGSWIR